MSLVSFPVIDPAATGKNIMRLRLEQGLTVRDVQVFFGFEEPPGHLQVAEREKPAHRR